MFNEVYKNKKVIVTGNTGFKGSWLTAWLLALKAEVVGVSKDVPTSPSMFEKLELSDRIRHYYEDVRDDQAIAKIIEEEKPDFVFHLAAQAIVSTAYTDPIETIQTNVIGTTSILEALRNYNNKCVGIIVTSDKCYDNIECLWGYKETDHLGGKDIYSGSKAAAEAVFKSYFYSFFREANCKVRIASARAGNVIGGGDWAIDRIVPDCMRAWNLNGSVEIRSPEATRPWQHVLEPLSGYLNLGQQLWLNNKFNGESFNFGPKSDNNYSVLQLMENLSEYWGFEKPSDAYLITDNISFHEASLLKLNCDKALFHLKWLPTLDYVKLIEFTGKWYYKYYREGCNMLEITTEQIEEYVRISTEKKIAWAR
jgi:CDP-glucose 4,6-dehydratase